jgi:hypothetical protein
VTDPHDAEPVPPTVQHPDELEGYSGVLPSPLSDRDRDLVGRLVALSLQLPDVVLLIEQGGLSEEKRRGLAHDLRETARRVSPPPGNCGHLSVNVTPNTQTALDLVAETEGVTITEALRRLVGYGDLVYETTRVNGDEVLIRSGNRVDRIILEHAPNQPSHESGSTQEMVPE